MIRYVRGHGRIFCALFCVGVGLVLVLFRLTSLSDAFGLRATWLMTDFKTAIYYPVIAFVSGENPYSVARFMQLYPVKASFPLYFPATLLLHLPFGYLSVGEAVWVYFLLTLGLTFTLSVASLAFNRIPVRVTDVLLIAGLILLSRPGHWNLLVGQPALQMVLASYLALYFSERSPIISGLGLALSVTKLTFGVPIAILLLIQGRFRTVLYGGVIALLVNLPLTLALADRAGGMQLFWQELVNNFTMWEHYPVVNPNMSIIRIDVTAFISHFLDQPLNGFVQLLFFLGILGTAGWVLLQTAKLEDEKFKTLATGVTCLATLLSIHHQAYDLLLLTLPFVGMVYRRFPSEFYTSSFYRTSVGLMVFLAINYATTHSVMRFIPPENVLWLILVSTNCLALLTLFVIWVRTAYLLKSTLLTMPVSAVKVSA
jgi:hypothetical protein